MKPEVRAEELMNKLWQRVLDLIKLYAQHVTCKSH